MGDKGPDGLLDLGLGLFNRTSGTAEKFLAEVRLKLGIENWSLFRLSDRKQFDNLERGTVDFFFRALSDIARADWLMWREGFTGWRPLSELPEILKHLQVDVLPAIVPPPIPEAVLKFADEVSSVTRTSTVSEEVLEEVPDEVSDVVELTPTPTPSQEVTHSSVSVRALHAATSTRRHLRDQKSEVSVAVAPKKATTVPYNKVITMAEEATMSLMLESQAAVEDRNNVRYQKRFKVRIFTPKGVLSVVTTDCSTSGFRLKDPLPAGLPRFFHVEIDLGPEGKIPLVCSEIREADKQGATRVRIQVNDHLNTLKSALVRAA